jgi:hypothetical protein
MAVSRSGPLRLDDLLLLETIRVDRTRGELSSELSG